MWGLGKASVDAAVEPELPSLDGEYLIRQWTSDDGLPQNSVIAMTQTTDGYLWLSTFGGLARFDGLRFEVFDPDHVPELTGNFQYLCADRQNRLWISGDAGKVVLYTEGRFHRLASEDGLPPGGLARVAVAPDGNIWAGAEDGRLLRFDGRRFIVVAAAPGPNWGGRWQLVFDSTGRIWTEDHHRFAFYANGQWQKVQFPEGRGGLSIIPLGDGSVILPHDTYWNRWVDDRIERFDPGPFPSRGANYRVDSAGNCWIFNQGRPRRRSPSGTWSSLTQPANLTGSVHRSSYEDKEGNLWVGTDGAGLFRLRQRGVQAHGEEAGLTHPVVLSVHGGEAGPVRIAVHGAGVWEFDGARFQHVVRDPNLDGGQLAWSVWTQLNGAMWVGTYGQGLLRVPAGSGSVDKYLPVTHPGVLGGPQFALHIDKSGRVWCGGPEGLSCLEGDHFRLWSVTNGLPDNLVRAIASDGAAGVWVGGPKGLARVSDTAVKVFTRADGMAHDTVRALFAESDGTLWIGGGGLTRLKAGKFSAIRAADGLPVETIKSVLADDIGGLWWGTPHGIFHCSRRELEDFCDGRRSRIEVTQFDRSDGMPSNECSGYQPGAWKGPDGRLWFATLNGLAVIDPKHLPKNSNAPPVAIEAVYADGLQLEPGPDGFQVRPGTLLIEFRYTALSFVASEKNQFRCHLAGFEERPRDTGKERFATYTRPTPGHYTFRVTASNNDGIWNATGAAVTVTVQPFVWQTLPFRVGTGGAALGCALFSARWLSQRRLRRQVAALEREHAIDHERARIARNMHDDVGASLTQIGLLSELARRQLHEPHSAEARLNELGDLSREVVRNLDALVWTVAPEHDTVAGLAEYLAGFAQEFLRPTGIAFRLDLPATLPNTVVPATARHQVLLLFKEALNNLLKHSGATEATFRAEVTPHLLRLELTDNGQGFDPATAGRFNDGLVNMQRRAQNAGGTCEILSRPGEGTRIRLDLPVGRCGGL